MSRVRTMVERSSGRLITGVLYKGVAGERLIDAWGKQWKLSELEETKRQTDNASQIERARNCANHRLTMVGSEYIWPNPQGYGDPVAVVYRYACAGGCGETRESVFDLEPEI